MDTSSPDHVVTSETELRTALEAGGVIVYDTGGAPETVTVPSELAVTRNTVVDGQGLLTIDGGGASRIFNKAQDVELTVQNMTLTGGLAPDFGNSPFDRSGGAIYAGRGGALTVIDAVFENNHTLQDGNDLGGGAIMIFAVPKARISGCTFLSNSGSNGGAINSLGSDIIVVNSLFQDNNATGNGDGLRGHGGALRMDGVDQNGLNALFSLCGSSFINNESGKGGGALHWVFHDETGSTASITKCTFEGNHQRDVSNGQGGAIFGMTEDGGGRMHVDLSITETTFTGNVAGSRGGGVWYWGRTKALSVVNCTFENNRTADEEYGMGGGLAVSSGRADIINATFANNYAWFHGGGIQAGGDNDVTVQNCLFFNNISTREWAGHHANTTLGDGGGNLQFPEGGMDVTASVILADPLLLPLADNGGPTRTMALQPGSPAVDQGVSGGAPSTDQRGVARDSAPDIGAYEAEP